MTKDNDDALRCATDLAKAASAMGREVSRLVAENEALNHYRKVYGEVSAILACTAEMPPPSDDDEITVQRLKALVQDFAVYVDSCAAKADRIDRLGEAVVKLRAENEAKDALLRQAVGALEFHQEQTRPIYRTRDAIAAIRQHLEGKA